MILADKIITLRKKQGWSQEELAEKLDVSRQSVSKWESGLSVPDLNKIIAMSALFGMSTDYLLKDELGDETPSETADSDDQPKTRSVSAEEAHRYMDVVEHFSLRIAIGVMLCILSPVCLLLLAGWVDEAGPIVLHSAQNGSSVTAIGGGAAVAIGMLMLFVLVGVALTQIIPAAIRLSAFSYIEKECISLEYGVRGIVEKKREQFQPRFIATVTVGVVLCVLSVVPLIVLGAMEAPAAYLVAATSFILLLCSIAVALIVRVCYINGSHQKLLQTGEFTEQNKRRTKENEPIETVYWCFFTAIYLGISFVTFDWHITWILWPVAGCLFPVFQYIVELVRKK